MRDKVGAMPMLRSEPVAETGPECAVRERRAWC